MMSWRNFCSLAGLIMFNSDQTVPLYTGAEAANKQGYEHEWGQKHEQEQNQEQER